MSHPSHESDDTIEALLRGEKYGFSEQDSDGDAELMRTLVSKYHAKPLSGSIKQRIWQKAHSEKERNIIVRPYFKWKGSLVAGLVLVTGLLSIFVYAQLNEAGFGTLHESAAATEVILEDTPPLFSDMPIISPAFGFEYGGYATISNQIAAGTKMQDVNMSWVAISVFHDGTALLLIESQIEAAHLSGFKIMVSVSGSEEVMESTFPENYARFVGNIAQAGADAIEIWPEANLDRYLPQTFFGAENYALILTEASAAIRANNPNTLVISGAPAPTGAEDAYPNQVINDDNFLAQLMNLGALDAVDCIGMHYLEGTLPPLATSGDARDDYYTRYLPIMLQRYREIVQARKPICVTSIGYFSTEGLAEVPQFFEWGASTSREEQEQWLSDALEWLSLQTDVRLGIVWNIDYENSSPNDPSGDGYALTFPREE